MPIPSKPSIRLHIEDSGGDGRPVVLIHGWPLTARSWGAQLGPLHEAGFRVIAYDRRGFGRSAKPDDGYDYDTLADDLDGILEARDLYDVTLVGFSMGGGEVARYAGSHGEQRLRSVVFASAVTPCMMRTADNPKGPLQPDKAKQMKASLEDDREGFFGQFVTEVFTADGKVKVDKVQRDAAIKQCHQADQHAALACMQAFIDTDFRADLPRISVPTLVLHGDSDGVVPMEGSGLLTHEAISGSELSVIEGAPHGCNVSHADEFNRRLLDFLNQDVPNSFEAGRPA